MFQQDWIILDNDKRMVSSNEWYEWIIIHNDPGIK